MTSKSVFSARRNTALRSSSVSLSQATTDGSDRSTGGSAPLSVMDVRPAPAATAER
ncbi:hypothetical protein ACFQ6B_27305 [Streptomyces wedmorensis]|uniref:Uncharacterized protein n=1 Tax=Streptomyces wedmorensis TaxID=43759 RepID=A0ABW6IM63_STRWE